MLVQARKTMDGYFSCSGYRQTTPALKGHVWYYLEGNARNNDKSKRTVMVESITIVDAANKVYQAENNKVMYYIDPPKGLSMVRIKPGEEKGWATYIAVPTSAKEPKLRVIDLKFKSRKFGYINLPAPVAKKLHFALLA